MYIYWLWGRSETGIVLADTEEEAKKKVIDFYELDETTSCYHKTVEEIVWLEKVNGEIVEVYSE